MNLRYTDLQWTAAVFLSTRGIVVSWLEAVAVLEFARNSAALCMHTDA